jgi:hypothetical protein
MRRNRSNGIPTDCGGMLRQAEDAGSSQCQCKAKNCRLIRFYILTKSLARCGLAIIMASVSMGSGTHGTMKRIRTRSFLSVLRLGFGTANPNAFTAYFLPKHACLPSHLSAIMAKKRNVADCLSREARASSQMSSGPITGRLSFHFYILHTTHFSHVNLSVTSGPATQQKGKRFVSPIRGAYSDRVISFPCQ